MNPTTANLLRPKGFKDYIGQPALKRQLSMLASASVKERRPMPSMFIEGFAGCGKTSLGRLLSTMVYSEFLELLMPHMTDDNYRDLDGFVGLVLIDEVQEASKAQMMEFSPMLDEGFIRPKGRPRIDFAWLTVMAATTDPLAVRKRCEAFRSRFMVTLKFAPYTEVEMTAIAARMASKLDVEMKPLDLAILGRASQGKPRFMESLVVTAHSMQVDAGRPVSAMDVLDMKSLAVDGLEGEHIEYLQLLARYDQPLGMDYLKQLMPTQNEASIREMERPLLRLGYIEPSSRGRVLTGAGSRRVKQLTAAKGNANV